MSGLIATPVSNGNVPAGASAVFLYTATLSRAQLAAAGGVNTHLFNLSPALPANARFFASEVEITDFTEDVGNPDVTVSLQGTGDPTIDAIGTTGVIAGGVAGVYGTEQGATNNYFSRSTQVLQTTIHLSAGTFNTLSGGTVTVRGLYVLIP